MNVIHIHKNLLLFKLFLKVTQPFGQIHWPNMAILVDTCAADAVNPMRTRAPLIRKLPPATVELKV